jgi:hypothetical protein
MSTQTMTHNVECICAHDYLEATMKGCLKIDHMDIECENFHVVPDTTQKYPGGNLTTKEKGNENTRLQDFLAMLRDILFSHLWERTGRQQADLASTTIVIYKSNGCSIQPMIWNPGGAYDENSK